MNKILKKTYFSERVVQLVVEAPLIARSRKPGNFVIVRVGEKGERMPLTISDADEEKGTITLVVQKMGVSSTKLCDLNEGDYITDLVGPLGKPTEISKVGTVLACGGGVGVAGGEHLRQGEVPMRVQRVGAGEREVVRAVVPGGEGTAVVNVGEASLRASERVR